MNPKVLASLVLGVSLCAAATPEPTTEDDVFALAPAAKAGDRKSIRSLFALYAGSDGAVMEEIDIALGATIRKHARMFLEELKRSGRNELRGALDGMLGNTGEEFVDRVHARLEEMKSRRASLAAVSDRGLLALRDQCLNQVDQDIEQLSRIDREEQP